MTFNDIIRWGWTLCTGFGLAYALWNLREVLIDNWVLSQSPQRTDEVVGLQMRTVVWEHTLIVAALSADFIAGVSSFFALSLIALVALLLSALFLIALSFTQTQRRNRLLKALRLRRHRHEGSREP